MLQTVTYIECNTCIMYVRASINFVRFHNVFQMLTVHSKPIHGEKELYYLLDDSGLIQTTTLICCGQSLVTMTEAKYSAVSVFQKNGCLLHYFL